MDTASRRPLLLRIVEDYWGVLLLLNRLQAWVVATFSIPSSCRAACRARRSGEPPRRLSSQCRHHGLAVAGRGSGRGMRWPGLAVRRLVLAVAAGLLNPLTVLFSFGAGRGADPGDRPIAGLRHLDGAGDRGDHYFFPSFVFASAGLRACRRAAPDLFHVLGASRLTLLRRLALPAPCPISPLPSARGGDAILAGHGGGVP